MLWPLEKSGMVVCLLLAQTYLSSWKEGPEFNCCNFFRRLEHNSLKCLACFWNGVCQFSISLPHFTAAGLQGRALCHLLSTVSRTLCTQRLVFPSLKQLVRMTPEARRPARDLMTWLKILLILLFNYCKTWCFLLRVCLVLHVIPSQTVLQSSLPPPSKSVKPVTKMLGLNIHS